MGALREILREEHPELHASLERSWKIAWEEWLPALGVMQGTSFNSYPHLRNIEQYLDETLVIHDPSRRRLKVDLSGPELYLLLAGVLFHDIGRIFKKTEEDRARAENREERVHAELSQELILRDPASLGIPSLGLAECLGRICHYHDPGAKNRRLLRDQSIHKLHDTNIHPYGEIRQLRVAALLFLGDHLDSAYTRVMPYYLTKDRAIKDPVGEFRKVIRGVHVDHDAKMAKTVLGHLATVQSKKVQASYRINEEHPSNTIRAEIDTLSSHQRQTKYVAQDVLGSVIHPVPSYARSMSRSWRRLLGLLAVVDPPLGLRINAGLAILRSLSISNRHKFSEVDWLIARSFIKLDKDSGNALTRHKLIAIILSDIYKNSLELKAIQTHFAAMGMPVLAWVIQHNERLFNYWGEETYEPIFSRSYLKDVVEAMWDLSIGIFGSSLFTYEQLASYLREPDVGKIKMAARRIAIVTSDLPAKPKVKSNEDLYENAEWCGAVWAGAKNWRWNCGNREVALSEPRSFCLCCSPQDVKKKIMNLKDPAGDDA